MSKTNYNKAKAFLLPLSSGQKEEERYSQHLGLSIDPWYVEIHGSLRTGLLQCPSAEMNRDGTFMITNNFLNEYSLSPRWGYSTFGYGFNLSVFKRLEIGYVCAIFDGKRHPDPSERDLIMFNQDRHFTAKALLLKEGEFGYSWLPAVAVGFSDPFTESGGGEYIGSDVSGGSGNGFSIDTTLSPLSILIQK